MVVQEQLAPRILRLSGPFYVLFILKTKDGEKNLDSLPVFSRLPSFHLQEGHVSGKQYCQKLSVHVTATKFLGFKLPSQFWGKGALGYDVQNSYEICCNSFAIGSNN